MTAFTNRDRFYRRFNLQRFAVFTSRVSIPSKPRVRILHRKGLARARQRPGVRQSSAALSCVDARKALPTHRERTPRPGHRLNDLSATGRSRRGFMLIEVLVYISILAILLGLGYAALYQCMDNSAALRRSAGDIARALHAGENWRADVRAAHGRIRVETNSAGCLLHLPESQGSVDYRFADQAVFRREGQGSWSRVLPHVKRAVFVPERREGVNAWRWELELQIRTRKEPSVQPLFTFIAVPGAGASQ